MKKSIKIFLVIIVVGLVTGLSTVYYVFNMPHRNIEKESPSFTMDASALYGDFSKDEVLANDKYADKVVEVKGEIAELTVENYQVSIVLNDEMEGVNCALDSLTVVKNKEMIKLLKIGDAIILKGKCDGFDMIMGVVLTQCFIVK